MRDKSLIFLGCLVVGFLLLGSAFLYRVSPETLPERSRSALKTAGLTGLTATFDGNKAFLLGEAPDENSLTEAVQVIQRVRGVESVDRSHATVKVPLDSPYMSLAFAGDQISIRGRVSSEETKTGILAVLEERFPEAEMHHGRLEVRDDVEDFGGFAGAPRELAGIGEKERGRGVVAAVGGDLAWVVVQSGAGTEEISAGLSKVLPDYEVEETKDEFDDVLTAEILKDERAALRREVEDGKVALAANEAEVKAMGIALAESNTALKVMTERAKAGEVRLEMTRDELSEREDQLEVTRTELLDKERNLAEANMSRKILEAKLVAMEERAELAKFEFEEKKDRFEGEMGRAEAKEEALMADYFAVREELEVTRKRVDEVQSRNLSLQERYDAKAEEAAIRESSLRREFADEMKAMRAESTQLREALSKAEARGAELEAKVTEMHSPRPTPDSVASAEISAASRAKELEGAREAAAATDARKSAANGVEQAEEMKKARGEEGAKKKAGGDEKDPSGKPVPFMIPVKVSKLDTLERFSAKNVGRGERGAPEGGITGDPEQGESLWKQVEERDRLILELERKWRAEKAADAEVIESLREENAALRQVLEKVTGWDGGGADGDEGTPEGAIDEFEDPLEATFAQFEGRIRDAEELGLLDEGGEEILEDDPGLTAAFGEIADLQGRISELELELAKALFEKSEALERASASAERAANLEVVAVAANRGGAPDAGSVFQRPETVEGKLKSILSYP